MSSAVVSTSAALGRPFVFEDEAVPEVCLPPAPAEARPPQRVHRPMLSGDLASADPRLARVTSASHIKMRPAPEMVSSGIPALDALTGGLPRGCLTEICGPASSGRTTLLLSALSTATRRGEFCVVVDASDALDPHSAADAGVNLGRLLWIRCGEDPPPKSRAQQNVYPRSPLARDAGAEHVERAGNSLQTTFDFDRTGLRQSEHRLEKVLRATDLLLESGGFGLIILDLGDLPTQAARRIPLTTWFRFRRAVENKPTILLAIEQQPIAGSCSSLLLQLGSQNNRGEAMHWKQSKSSREAGAWESPARQCGKSMERGTESRMNGATSEESVAHPTHAQLLTGLDISAELIRSRLEHKPPRSTTAFTTKTAWAG